MCTLSYADFSVSIITLSALLIVYPWVFHQVFWAYVELKTTVIALSQKTCGQYILCSEITGNTVCQVLFDLW
jgi:hypothetical protein